MAWTLTVREKALRNRQQKAVVRDAEIIEKKRLHPELSLYDLAKDFNVSHMTIKRALDKQSVLDI